MKCIVCESGSEKYFDKTYFESPVNINLKVSYRKCTKCGFVFSETHQTMPKNEWEEYVIKAKCFGESISLGIPSRGEEDEVLINSQLLNSY